MKARDVMISPAIIVKPSATVKDVAKLFLECQISAVPIVDESKPVGIVSEGDFVHRAEIGTASLAMARTPGAGRRLHQGTRTKG